MNLAKRVALLMAAGQIGSPLPDVRKLAALEARSNKLAIVSELHVVALVLVLHLATTRQPRHARSCAHNLSVLLTASLVSGSMLVHALHLVPAAPESKFVPYCCTLHPTVRNVLSWSSLFLAQVALFVLSIALSTIGLIHHLVQLRVGKVPSNSNAELPFPNRVKVPLVQL